jgi:ribosomal protein S18 acetylase RimI-like enzyme
MEPDDDPFLLDLEADRWGAGPADPLAALQFRARQQGYRLRFPDGDDSLVVVDGEPAGRLLVAPRPEAHHLVDIALLRRYRGQGIGTELVGEVQAAAAAAGLPVELTVLTGDSAVVGWYGRLGFEPVSSGAVHVRMIWSRSGAR